MQHGMPNPQRMPPQAASQALQPQSAAEPNGASFNEMNHVFNAYDPMLDADPFGLSASMHFPTQFTFEGAR
jgi:hypothetical protein